MTWVEAPAQILDAIEGDSQIRRVLPARAKDQEHLRTILNAPLQSLPQVWRNTAKTFLESHGVNLEWITGTSTLKDVLRQLIKIFSVQQIAAKKRLKNVDMFLQSNLGLTVSKIPPEAREEIRDWLGTVGVNVSWIKGNTTVREVVAVLPGAFDKLYERKQGAFFFAGEEF